MKHKLNMSLILALFLGLAGVAGCDDNSRPNYGEETGLPKNCRAYVQASIDGYRAGKYSADDALAGLERNCGMNGYLWKDNQ